MYRTAESIYHLFNRGNNSQNIFFCDEHYEFFLDKAKTALLPQCHVLAYCLMPNHFHFLLLTKPSFQPIVFSARIRIWLSSYSRAMQKQRGTTGSLFQQNTKTRHVDTRDYATTCFHYIHQNPVKAGIRKRIENWPYSSFPEYWWDDPGICNKEAARSILDLPANPAEFYTDSSEVDHSLS